MVGRTDDPPTTGRPAVGHPDAPDDGPTGTRCTLGDVGRWLASGPWWWLPAVRVLRRWGPPALAVAVTVLVVSPLVAAYAHLHGGTWYPVGDQALIELRTADVGKAATPLLGPYSRFGWNHPGPLEFYVLAPLFRAYGSASMGLLLGTLLVNAAALAATMWVAYRRGRLALVLGAGLVLALLLRSMGATDLTDPWNPYITLLPFALFLVLVWSVLDGDLWMLPLVALTGSFLVQTHVSFALQVSAGVLLALLGVWRARRVSRLVLRPHGVAAHDAVAFGPHRRRWPPASLAQAAEDGWPTRRGLRRVLVVTGAVLAVCWLPVAVDAVAGRHNATDLARFFLDGSRPNVGAETASKLVALELGSDAPWRTEDADRGPWAGGPEPVDAHGGEVTGTDLGRLAWPLGLFLAGMGLAWAVGPRGRSALRLGAVVGTASVVGALATAKISDLPYNYLLRWWWVVAALLWLAIGWALWTAAEWRSLRWWRWLVVIPLLPALWGISTATVSAASEVAVPIADLQAPIGALAGPVTAATPAGANVQVRGVGSFHNMVGDGLLLQLIRSGRRVVVDPEVAYKFGEDNVATDGPDAVVFVVSNDSIGRYRARDDVREIASYDPLTPDERQRFAELDARLRQQLRDAGRPELVGMFSIGDSLVEAKDLAGVDQDLLRQVEELRAKGMPVAAFLGDRAALEREGG